MYWIAQVLAGLAALLTAILSDMVRKQSTRSHTSTKLSRDPRLEALLKGNTTRRDSNMEPLSSITKQGPPLGTTIQPMQKAKKYHSFHQPKGQPLYQQHLQQTQQPMEVVQQQVTCPSDGMPTSIPPMLQQAQLTRSYSTDTQQTQSRLPHSIPSMDL